LLSAVPCAIALAGSIMAASPSESTMAFRFIFLVFILLVWSFRDLLFKDSKIQDLKIQGLGFPFWGWKAFFCLFIFFRIGDLQ
jgi:hypothetical protein